MKLSLESRKLNKPTLCIFTVTGGRNLRILPIIERILRTGGHINFFPRTARQNTRVQTHAHGWMKSEQLAKGA